MRAVSADGAGVGRNRTKGQAHALEDSNVGGIHRLVALAGGFDIAIERVRVLHRELAPAHHAEARPALVAKFGLDVIEIFRQRAVTAQLLARDVGDDFFAGRLDDEVAVVAVFHAQQLGPVLLKAPGLLPQLGWLHDRHQQLDSAGPIHLFANDRFDFANHPQAHRHVAVDAGAEPLDEPGAHHQLMADDLSVGGGFLECGYEELGGFHAGRRRGNEASKRHDDARAAGEGNPRGSFPSYRCNNRFNENFGVDYARP